MRTGQPPIRLHFARCHWQNARFAYEKEQKFRTLREDAEIGWALIVNWASDQSQNAAMKPRFQFRLRTLFVVVTLAAVPCAFITTEPNELMAAIHDRMPVILCPDDYNAWLDPATDKDAAQVLLRPYPADEMTATPVSTLVNSPKNDVAACIEPA